MAKLAYTRVPAVQRRDMVKALAKFLLAVGSERAMVQVLYRLLTPSEIVMLGRRLQIAEELLHGKSYRKIKEKYKVGVGTIRSVDKWLEEAIHDYELIREDKRADKARKNWRPDSDIPGSWGDISQRYGTSWPLELLDLLLGSSKTEAKKK